MAPVDWMGATAMPKRVLVLGITGINKANAVDPADESRGCILRFADYERREHSRQIDVVDLWKDYPTPVRLPSYLYQEKKEQIAQWVGCWNRFVEDLGGGKWPEDVYLCMHGVITNEVYGLRSPVLVGEVARDFSPDVVITLIDDVYTLYERTQARAGGIPAKGVPTLEQLVVARRAETVVGDLIAHQTNAVRAHRREGYGAQAATVRNYVVAVGHPLRLLDTLVYAANLLTAYVSHPISEPRRMAEDGNADGLRRVNEYLARMVEFERRRLTESPKVALFYPATIDELPLVRLIFKPAKFSFMSHRGGFSWQPVGRKSLWREVHFDLSGRWNLESFFGEDELLSEKPHRGVVKVPTEQLTQAAGSLVADIGWRDTTLIGQCDKVASCCPLFNRRRKVSGGMASEMNRAVRLAKLVNVMQVPDEGTKKMLERILARGRLISDGEAAFVTVSDDWDEFFQMLLRKL